MHTSDQSNEATFSSSAFFRRLIPAIALLNLIVIGVVVLSLYRGFNQSRDHAEASAQNLSYVLALNIGNVIDEIDLGLLGAADEIDRHFAEAKTDGKTLTTFLSRLQQRLPLIVALRATDEKGLVRYGTGVPDSPRVDWSDRDYFIRLRDDPHAGLVISQPNFGRITKDWGLVFARRLQYSDGAFAGVVYTRVSLANFEKIFSNLDVGHHGAINMRDANMGLIVRYPEPADVGSSIGDRTISPEFRKMLAAGYRSGVFYTPTSFDNTARVVSFRPVSNFPLFVSVGLAKDDYLVEWQHEVMQMSGLLILFAAISVGASRLITRTWQHQIVATKKLALEKEKFHTVADYTYDWEYWEGSHHEVLYMSPSCLRVTGYSVAEFTAHPDLLMDIIHPDDRHLMEFHRHDATNQELAEIDFRIIRRDGEIRWISHCCQAVHGADDSYMGRRVTNRDITDHHLFEAEINRLAQAVEQNPTGILITDKQGTLSYTNQAYTKITGYQFAEAYGKTQRELISSELTDEVFKEIETCLGAGKPWSGMLQNRHRNGTLYWEQITASPMYGDSGQAVSYLYLRTDISERKQNEEELRRYRDHLEDEVQQRTVDLMLARNAAETANHAKSVFLANMSHELRTPLNAILGFSNMMRNDARLQADHQQNLDVINRSGEHLLTLINDILDMAKIEAGRVQLESAPFDLGGMVRDVTDMMDVRAREKGLQLLIDQSSEFPRYIVGDEARLRQVLINLVGNALKFTEQGGVTVRLGTKNNAIAHLLLEVEDSGPGIAPEDQQRIFEPFEQLGSSGGNQGTGLGLTITRQFVQLMGGHIELESTLGKGSLFRIDLPLKQADETDVTRLGDVEKGEVAGLAPGQPEYRILVVEDQLENRLLLTKLMESVGFQVKSAENGQQGVELFQSWRPHLIWMDHRMPVMDGDEATRTIRSLPGGKDVKIVAVTASAFSEQRSELLKAGMDDFLRKPYRFNEIFECASKQLGVQYTYRGATAPMDEASALTPEMLSILPESLRQELIQALESLDSDRIEPLIQQVAMYDANFQKALTHLANNFDYPTILKALHTL
jgi:PAS domain S-box-containing protein